MRVRNIPHSGGTVEEVIGFDPVKQVLPHEALQLCPIMRRESRHSGLVVTLPYS